MSVIFKPLKKLFSPKIDLPEVQPLPEPVTETSTDVDAAREAEKKRARLAAGRSATITNIGGARGLLTDQQSPPTLKKLLGQ